MANVIKLKSGDSGDSPASDALARGEVAIRHVAANHTASSSSKLYFGEGQGSGSVTLRQFGFGITDGSTQSGVAIGENLTFTGGNAISTSVSGNAVTINHDDTSSQASVNNSGSTFIQDITIDTYGHVTGITSADAGGGSGLSGLGSTDNVLLRANGTGGDTAQGSGITVDDNDNMLIPGASDIRFRDSDLSISSSTDQFLDIVSDRYVRVDVDYSDNSGAFIVMDSTESAPTQKIYLFPDDNPTMRLDANGGTFGQLTTAGGHLYVTSADDIFIGGDGSNGVTTVDDIHINVGDGHVLNFDEDGTTRATFNLDSTPELDVTGHFTIDCNDDITLDADGGQINFADGSDGNVFTFDLSTSPEMNINTNFKLDSAGTIEIESVGDLELEAGSSGNIILDAAGDITLDADGSDITLADGGNTRINFDLDSSPTMDVTGAFDLKSSSSILLDAATDITLDAAGDDIMFEDAGSERFRFNLSSTPELDVTGNFKIDGSGTIEIESVGDLELEAGSSGKIVLDAANTIELDGTGGIKMTEGGAATSTVTLRPTTHFAGSEIMSDSNIQYYHASSQTVTATVSSGVNNNVYFLPALTGNEAMNTDDNIHHTFQAPCNGRVLAIVMSSNNSLFKDEGANSQFTAVQLLESNSSGNNVFGGSVDVGDTRVTGVDADGNSTGVSEINATRDSTDADVAEAVYNFAEQGNFNLVGGKTYAFGWRITTLPAGQTTKTHSLNINYIISWDETTSDSSFAGWTGY